MKRFVFCVLLSLSQLLNAQDRAEKQALPDPLTLDFVQSLASDASHATLIEADASIERVNAELKLAESAQSLQIDFELQAAIIEPSILATDQDSDDHKASLRISKSLYDFGQTQQKVAAAELEQSAIKSYLPYVVARRHIEITRDYFNVILADLKYAWDNESLAIAYIQYENAQHRQSLGQLSDIEILTEQKRYDDSRMARYTSESEQFLKRVALSEIINRPGELSSNLVTPVFDVDKRELLDFEALINTASQNNYEISLLTAQVKAAYNRLQASRLQNRPVLEAEIEVAEYSRDSASHDDWRAQLNLKIPLLEHEGIQAEVARTRSLWLQQRAMLETVKTKVRQRTVQLWQQINLLNTRREQLKLTQELRELELDQSRALYEMEVNSNLGTTMTAISEVRYKQGEIEFGLVLAWMELDLLLGKGVEPGVMQ